VTYKTTIIKLEGYGQWTLGLGSDREYRLQILQSKIYAELQELFSDKNGLVFSNRFDEFIAVTNNIDIDSHIKIYEQVSQNNEKIGISMTIGLDETPLRSNRNAHYAKNKKEYLILPNIYSTQDNKFGKVKSINAKTRTDDGDYVKILHIDINNSTAMTKNLSSYETTNTIINLYSKISNIFLKEECLTFYLGGDNFMILAEKNMAIEKVKEMVNLISTSTKINLNCGIGIGKTGRKAAEMATKSLDEIRELRRNGTIVNVYESY
jgi:GTP cyclohydrolase IIa